MTQLTHCRIANVGWNLEAKAGGIYRSVLNFRNALEASAAEVRVIHLAQRETGSFPGEAVRIEATSIPILKEYSWCHGVYRQGFESMIRSADVCFLHGLFIHGLDKAASIRWRCNKPYMVVVHGSLDPYVFSYRRLRKRLWLYARGRSVLERAARVVFSSRREIEKAQWCGIPYKPVVINWPVPVWPACNKLEVAARVLGRHGLRPGTRILLFCGRLHPSKRPLETIEAFCQTASRDWVFLLVGPPSREIPADRLRSACEDTGGRCLYLGPAFGDVLREYYEAADLFVSLSLKDNFGYTIADALAAGVPVLIGKGVDIFPDVEREGAGFIVADESSAGFDRALKLALSFNAGELAAMGARGRQWVGRTLSMDRFQEQLSVLVRDVLRDHESSFAHVPVDAEGTR